MRVPIGSTVTVASPVFVAVDGESQAALDGAPTVTVTRSDGTALAAPAVELVSVGQWTATLAAAVHTDQLDVLAVKWVGEVGGAQQTHSQQVLVVGGRVVSLYDLRSERSLEDTAKFPKAHLEAVLDQFDALVEDWCQVAFVPRLGVVERVGAERTIDRVLVDVHQRPTMSVRWLTVDGVSQDVDDWQTDPSGLLTCVGSASTGRVVRAGVEYGYDSPPADLVMEGKRWCRERALAREVTAPSQAISETADGRTIRYSTPDPRMGRPTGSLDLDAVLKRIGERVPGVA